MKTENLIAQARAAIGDSDIRSALVGVTDRLEAVLKLYREMESDGWVIDPWDSQQFARLRKVIDGEGA